MTATITLPEFTDKQIKSRDDIATYIRSRMDLIINSKIREFLNRAESGELEAIDKLQWEWTIGIEGKEMEELKKLVEVYRGE